MKCALQGQHPDRHLRRGSAWDPGRKNFKAHKHLSWEYQGSGGPGFTPARIRHVKAQARRGKGRQADGGPLLIQQVEATTSASTTLAGHQLFDSHTYRILIKTLNLNKPEIWDLGPFASVLAPGQTSPPTTKYQRKTL